VIVAIGFGLAGFVVSRRLFRQSKPAALVQACFLAASTLESIKTEKRKQSLRESYDDSPRPDRSLTTLTVGKNTP
jgi:hypothetical protein